MVFELSLQSWHLGRWRFGKERNFTRCKEPLKIQDDETHNWEVVRTWMVSILDSNVIKIVLQKED